MTLRVSWPQALAWRLHRQLLAPVTRQSVPVVVRRLCDVQAQVPSSADLAVRVRRGSSSPGDVTRVLSDGRLIKTLRRGVARGTWRLNGEARISWFREAGPAPRAALAAEAARLSSILDRPSRPTFNRLDRPTGEVGGLAA